MSVLCCWWWCAGGGGGAIGVNTSESERNPFGLELKLEATDSSLKLLKLRLWLSWGGERAPAGVAPVVFTSWMKWHLAPYWHKPWLWYVLQSSVLYLGCLLMFRSSNSPWANWHLSPYLQVPDSWKGLHSSVLYLEPPVEVWPDCDLLPVGEIADDAGSLIVRLSACLRPGLVRSSCSRSKLAVLGMCWRFGAVLALSLILGVGPYPAGDVGPDETQTILRGYECTRAVDIVPVSLYGTSNPKLPITVENLPTLFPYIPAIEQKYVTFSGIYTHSPKVIFTPKHRST